MDRDYELFITRIKKKTGIDLSLYKEAQMKRRLTSFYKRKGFKSFEDFYAGIAADADLLDKFLDRMTINVTEFFRNKNRWDVLEQKILPRLLSENKRLRVWSAASSTGEEPYTIAMMLSKYMPLSQLYIQATDIDAQAIAAANAGLYDQKSRVEVPDRMKRR